MPRQLRIEYPGAIYLVMNRGDRREPIFQEDSGTGREELENYLVEGTQTVDWAFTGNDGVTTPRSWSGTADPPSVARPGDSGGFLWIGYEHCVAKDSKPGSATWPDGSGGDKEAKDRVVYSRTAETVMKLFTGGKAESKRKNLFMLSASAWRTEGMTLKPNLLNDTCYWEWDLPPIWGPTKQVDSTDIEIDGKPLGSDGKLWRIYSDGDTPDVTPRVKNADVYSFNEPQPPKYHSYFDVLVIEGNPGGLSPIGEYEEGHAWWELRTEAPIEGLTNFLNNIELEFLSIRKFGFYPSISTIPGCLACVGKLEAPEPHVSGDATVQRHFYIGFTDLKNALDFTIAKKTNPGHYVAPFNNCVNMVRSAARAAGGSALPTTAWPQYFGYELQLLYWNKDRVYSPLRLP